MTLAESQTIRNLVRLHGPKEVLAEVAMELEDQAQAALVEDMKVLAEKLRGNATQILVAAGEFKC